MKDMKKSAASDAQTIEHGGVVYDIRIMEGEDGYIVAEAASVGAVTQGRTHEDALASLREAIDVSTGVRGSAKLVLIESPFAPPKRIDCGAIALCLDGGQDHGWFLHGPAGERHRRASENELAWGLHRQREIAATNRKYACLALADCSPATCSIHSYADHGLSKGMLQGIMRAKQEGRPVEYRYLSVKQKT